MEKPDRSITIVEVARMAGVSVSTVSRVINDKSPVHADTRERIREIIRRTNYMPNKLAKGLVSQHSKTIALIIPDIANPFFADIIHGVENTVMPQGYSIYLCNSNFNHDRERRFLEEMAERRAEGAVLVSAFLQNETLIHRLDQNAMRIVCIQTQIEGLDSINTNDYESMCVSVQHLVDQGHKRVAFICIDHRGCRMRYSAYKNVLSRNGLPIVPEYVKESVKSGFTDNPGYHLTQELLALPEPPTAIQALNDYMAYGAYQAAQEKGINIPQDLSVAGFDDLPLSKLLMPPLTTTRQPAYEMGQAGSDILLKRIIKGPRQLDQPCEERLFDTAFVHRASVAAPPCRAVLTA